jgi:peptide/nickel transport system permease protein
MLAYIIRRLLWVLLLLFVVSALTFIIFYLLPSADPAQLRAGRQPDPQLVEQIRHNLGLDRPWYAQYFDYMKQVFLHFDFGYSYQNTISVKEQIFDRLPATISLAIGAAVIWLIVGISVGIISAIKSRTLIDRVAMGTACSPAPAATCRSVRTPPSGSTRCSCHGWSSPRPSLRFTRACCAPT